MCLRNNYRRNPITCDRAESRCGILHLSNYTNIEILRQSLSIFESSMLPLYQRQKEAGITIITVERKNLRT